MRKAVTLALSMLASLAFAGHVYAGNLSVRLEQPKSPVNQNSFDVKFVALDILGRPVTVKCFKKGPGDAAFVQFGSDISLATGGNSGACSVTSSVFNGDGNYNLKVEATAGGDTATDQVSFTYDTSAPGDPRDYNKTKTSACVYNIHFKTADDGGATVKVEVYRSENTSFTADDGTRVGTVAAGSNETKDFPDTIPNCDKTYYYAIRSFDSAGNGSNLVGDSVTVTVAGPVVSPTPAQGAIPVSGGSGGNVLGEEASASPTPAEGQVQGESTPSTEEVTTASSGGLRGLLKTVFGNWLIDGAILALLVLAFFLWRAQQKPQA